MLKYIAILKDSLREAIDGWVFTVMLILSLLLIVLVAGVSYEPVEADAAFNEIIRHFIQVYPERGESVAARPYFCEYSFRDLSKLNSATAPQEGDYRLILTVKDSSYRVGTSAKNGNDGKDKKKPDPNESTFLQAVAYWNEPFDPLKSPDASKVNDELIVEFLRDQFSTFGNMEISKLGRIDSKAPDIYEFEVETKGSKGTRGWLHDPNFFGLWKMSFLRSSLGSQVFFVENTLVNGLGAWVALLIGVVITAFFIPNMMRKGAVDLLLSKPILRPVLLLYKYIGGLTFVFLTSAFAVGGIWLVIGLRSGVWSTGFLLTIFGITFYFAILYAVSTFWAVLTRNAIVAILLTIGFWFVMYIIGSAYTALDLLRKEQALRKEIPQWVFTTADIAHAVLPRNKDLDNLTTKLVVEDTLGKAEKRASKVDRLTFPPWGEVLGVSGAYIGVLLGLACWRFSTRDY